LTVFLVVSRAKLRLTKLLKTCLYEVI